MKEPQKNGRPRSRVKSRSNALLYTVCASIILFVTIFYFYTKEESVNAHSNNIQTEIAPLSSDALVLNKETQPVNDTNTISTALLTAEADTLPSGSHAIIHQTKEQLSEVIDENASTAEKETDRLVLQLNTFYDHLDSQPYMKDFNLTQQSKIHFSRLLQDLLQAPPVVTNETGDLFTILKNTAHFFRILGKENIIVLKGILDREKPSFENILKTFYTLTGYPEILKKEYTLTITDDALYDYACFFLNTMGGRLYLFRRDTVSRMTVSFYAIQIVDKAIKKGNNRHGIALLPAIDFLINEMENSGKNLLLKEQYLDTLYDMKVAYN